MAKPTTLAFFPNCVVYLLTFIPLFCSPNKTYAWYNERSKSYYSVVQVSSLLLAPSCNRSANGGQSQREGISLNVFHTSTVTGKAPTLAQIHAHDRSRRKSILLSGSVKPHPHVFKSESNLNRVDLPARSGLPEFELGEYMVTVGLGTPKRDISLIFDTGSHVLWTQCKPCLKCYKQLEPIFDPPASKTFKTVPCSSRRCSQPEGVFGIYTNCSSNSCIFVGSYGDGTFTLGNLAVDKLTLTPSVAVNNYIFGCGHYNGGPNGLAAGIMGLGRAPVSIVSQISPDKYFSYCLPKISSCSSTGHLSFGKPKDISKLKFTPLWTNYPFAIPYIYAINVTGIKVAGKMLPIPESAFRSGIQIIDSGTTATSFLKPIYTVLLTAIRREMQKYPPTKGDNITDTCYNLRKYKTVRLPKVSFYFKGDVEVPIPPFGLFFGENTSQICLAVSSVDPGSGEDPVAFIGNLAQQTLEIGHDVLNARIGFASGGCY
ncbi:Nepenthesin [Bertholletia excelsa]